MSIEAKSIAHAPSIRQIVLASSMGSFIDWYDFLIAATAAALVWPTVFFKFASGPVAAGLSLISFVAANFARPIGAFVFGNIGDRLGRRSTLTLTLVTMGVATFGIGLTPGYADVGWAAPALLLFWRLIFGVGVGGEWGGATSWIAEYASESRWRAFWNGFNAQVVPLAVAISAVSFPIVATLTGSGFMTFGWRIPFFIGGVAILIGVAIRYLTIESPFFDKFRKPNALEKRPAIATLRQMPGRVVLLSLALLIGPCVFGVVINPFSVLYLASIGVSSTFAVYALSLGSLVSIVPALAGAMIADMFGRRKIALVGAVLSGASVFPFFFLINTGIQSFIILGYVLIFSSLLFGYAVQPALATEQFPTRIRYSGSGMSFQFAALITGLSAGVLEPIIIVNSGGITQSWPYVALLSSILCGLAAISLLFIRETKGSNLAENGFGHTDDH